MRNDWRLGCIGCWLKRYRRDQPYRNHHVIHTVAQKSNSVFELCRGSDTPVWISVPKQEKWFVNASVSTTASWWLSKMIAVSSSYSESSNETGSPRALNYLPVIWASFLLVNTYGVAEHVTLQLLMVAVMKNVKSIGPKTSPCLTPILLLIGPVISSLSILTVNVSCKALRRFTSLGGTPYFNRIPHNSFLGTLSNALTRSRNKTHDSSPCSLLFLIADLIVKIASMQPRFGRKPHCCSWSSMLFYGKQPCV